MAILDVKNKPYIQDRDELVFIGIDLPFRKSDGPEGWFASTSYSIDAVKQNVLNLCSTEKGERVMQPGLGVMLKRFLFEPFDDDLVYKIQEAIVDSMKYWLPFVKLNDIRVEMADISQVGDDRNTLEITVDFSLKKDPSTHESVQITVGE